MTFRITGLEPARFAHLFGRSDAALAAQGASRITVDRPHTAPCRISLEDAGPGETVLLLNFEHQPADTPYRARHAIYVREQAGLEAYDRVDEVPPALARRTLSARAFDARHMMSDAELVEGGGLPGLLRTWFTRDEVAYVQVHYARRGCFAARAVRAPKAS